MDEKVEFRQIKVAQKTQKEMKRSVQGKKAEGTEKYQWSTRGLRVVSMTEREGKVNLKKIQPPHLIVLFCQEKPQMPVVKQRLDPFFGCERRS